MRLSTERRRDVRTGDTDATQALPGARDEQERAGAPAGRQPRHDSSLDSRRRSRSRSRRRRRCGTGRGGRCATKLDAYKPIIEARLAAYPELSAVRLLDGDPRGRLRGRLHAAESVRAAGAAGAAAGAGHPLRDAGGPPGAGRLRAISLSVGRALRLARRARLLAVAVVPVLSAPGHARR